MNFIPFQKYVVIEKIKEEDDLISNQSQFEKAKVIKVSSEISNIKEEDIVFIPSFAGDVYIENDKVYYLVTSEEIIGKFKK
jgi:co-chaperonin GroES (HSP10)